jgi:predicted alpha-1,6-mannanase (GH76 family)
MRLQIHICRLICGSLCAAISFFAVAEVTLAQSARQRADAGMAVLQNFYIPSNGLYNSPAGWWQAANALETTIDFSARANTDLYTQDVPNTYNKNNGNNFLNNYYDDEGWWATTWIKAYDLTGDVTYLNAAKTIFQDMTGGWDSTCNGGIWWSKARTYKNAIANELFLLVAARLHNRTPGDGGAGSFIDWAQKEWAWFSASGMINSSNLINDGLTINSTTGTCKNNGQTTWTYNQGVILGGLTDLYKATGDVSLLREAETIANAATTSPALVNSNGILVEPCKTANCGNDAPQFKGIFAKNLYYLFTTDQKSAYHNFLETNANSIWVNDRDSQNQFGLHWQGPFDMADGARQSAAEDVLNGVLPATSYSPVSAPGTYSFAVTAQTTGTYRLTFHFSAPRGVTATRTILVNSVPVANNFSFSGSGSAPNYATASIDVSLAAGLNQISVSKLSGNKNAVTIYSLEAAPAGASFVLYEAENADSNVGTESTYPGFTGKGYRCCWDSDGQYVTFNVSVKHPGAVQLVFHYAAGAGNASREVFVNGVPVNRNLAFPNTTAWADWSYVSLVANLAAGANYITVYYDSGSGNTNYLNLDNLQILY